MCVYVCVRMYICWFYCSILYKEEVDKDHLILLVLEVLPKDGCLVFCPTKNVALLLAQHFPEYVFLVTYVRTIASLPLSVGSCYRSLPSYTD